MCLLRFFFFFKFVLKCYAELNCFLFQVQHCAFLFFFFERERKKLKSNRQKKKNENEAISENGLINC